MSSNQKKGMKFSSIKELQSVVDIINEASEALGDKTRTIKDSPLLEAMANVLGAGGGIGAGFLALYGCGVAGLSAVGITTGLATIGGLIGGGMVAGVLVLSALPVAGIALTGGIIAKNIKRKQLKEIKKDLYDEASDRLSRIRIELEGMNDDFNEDRKKLLETLVAVLERVLQDLQYDLM